MHHSFIDRYSNLISPIHRLDPRLKIGVVFIAIIVLVISPHHSPLLFLIYAVIISIFWYVSHLPFKHLIERLSITIPFVAIIGLGIAFGHKLNDAVWWHSFVYLIVRATLTITLLTLLTSTTPFPMLLEGLHWFKLPKVLHSLLSFIYRFIYIIIDEFQRLNRGRKSREFGKHFLLSWKGRSWMLGTFLIKCIERSERVYQAMLSRGYRGN